MKEAGFVGINLEQGKKDYGDDGIFYGMIHAAEVKKCYTKDQFEKLNENTTFKDYHKSERIIETYKHLKL